MKIIKDKALLVHPYDVSEVLDVVPRSRDTNEGVVVYWGQEEAEALASLGFQDTPSPIIRDYEWTGAFDPYIHQKVTSAFLSIRRKAFCFNEQGTGKTASVIWAADYLMNIGKIKRVLVLCPLSIMKASWQQDLFKFAMHRTCSVAHGAASRREKIIDAGSEFVIINYDGVETVKEAIAGGGFDLIVIDEASAYKNVSTRRWKTLRKIVLDTDPAIWMLTGTPAAQSPVDAYGLAKMLDVKHCPKYHGAFRDSVLRRVSEFKWVPKPDAPRIVHKLLQPAIRYTKEECLDLPPVTFTERRAELTKQQEAYYNKLKEQMLFEASGEEVSAVNAATRLNKLLQISGGAVYTDTGAVLEFDITKRLGTVVEAIRETSNKALVFVPFTHTIQMLKERLDKEQIPSAIINGKVAANRRSILVDKFQTEEEPRVLIIQPAAAAHGLTLTAADTIIWYAPVTSVETYLQANARIDRPGQKHPMTVIHISGSPVEDRLYGMLQSNIDNHQKLIDLYKDEFN